MINPQLAENMYCNSKISQKSIANFVIGYALNLCKFHIYKVPYNYNDVGVKRYGRRNGNDTEQD